MNEELMMLRSAELMANAVGDEMTARIAARLAHDEEITQRKRTFKQLCSADDVVLARAMGVKLN